jgi:hypothetical protein
MERITVNLSDDVGGKLKSKADAANRTTSNYVALLIEKDLRDAGLLPPSDDETVFHAKLNEAIKQDKTLREKIEKLLKRDQRSKRTK